MPIKRKRAAARVRFVSPSIAPDGVRNAVPGAVPNKVAIVAMGASSAFYNSLVAQLGHRKALADETWVINSMASVLQHDRAFVMQDVATNIMEEAKERKVAQGILRWLPDHPGPVYTTTAYEQWPALVEYPTQDVLRYLGGPPYLNNSVAYALAYAMYIGVKEVLLFGADFTYPDAHVSESGRGCCEFVMGIGVARGFKYAIPEGSTMLDANKPMDKKLYGYAMPMQIDITAQGVISVSRKPLCTSTDTLSPSPPAPPPVLRLEA